MTIQEQHARSYMTYALEHREDWEDWDWFDSEWGQIQRAWDWLKTQRNPLGLAFLRFFDSFLDRRNLWQDEITWAKGE